jgi:acyl phosphate:glycerol-3-phosphate acyltransferase
VLGECFDEEEAIFCETFLEASDHFSVVDRVAYSFRAPRPVQQSDLEIELHRLRHAPFPLVDADQNLDSEIVDENGVHHNYARIRALIVCEKIVTAVLALLAYLMGSVSFAIVTSRAFRLPDPRTYGSGNPGATNVLRTGRKPAAALTLLGDAVKGWLAVVIAAHFAEPSMRNFAVAAAGVAVIVGHMYPIFFRFQGGKGVATALGVLFALNVYVALGTLATWLIIATFFRISSLAALVAALFAPFFTLILYNATHPYFGSVAIIAALLIWRHRANIRNLLAGTEDRLGRDKGF